MTVRSTPWIPSTPGQTVSGEIVRLAMASLVPSPGIASTTDLLVAANGTPNMTVNVAAGGVWIKGTSVGTQGSYFLYNDASLSVAIAAADPSNPRIDLIVAQIRDNAEDASGSTDARIVPVAGTPAGSPVAPATPASSIVLAQVAVAALAASIVSGNITDKRGATCGDGYVVCTSATRPTARTGLCVFETDTGAVRMHNGTGWVTVGTPGTAATDAWISYTPTLTNVTGGTVTGFQKTNGKTLDYRWGITAGTATGSGAIGVSLAGLTTAASLQEPQQAMLQITVPSVVACYAAAGDTKVQIWKDASGTPFGAGNSVAGYYGGGRLEVQ